MNKIYQVLGAGMFLIMSMHTQANIKQNIEQQGFVFVKQIPAPQGMTGWVGHEDQYSNTVFISNDDKYYIKGELFDAQGKSLSNEQIEKHMKKAVLDDVWKTWKNPPGSRMASQMHHVWSMSFPIQIVHSVINSGRRPDLGSNQGRYSCVIFRSV